MEKKVLGNRERGIVFILSAPAGTGKTTLAQKLIGEFPQIVASISYTTRLPRLGEVDGKDYFFISEIEFEKKIARHEFLEYVRLYGCYYGTSRTWIEARLQAGKHVILVIDTQGAIQLRRTLPSVAIFLQPPSLAELKRRLSHRGTETMNKIEERLTIAEEELKAVKFYDYQIVNDDLDTAYQVLKSIIIAEDHRVLI